MVSAQDMTRSPHYYRKNLELNQFFLIAYLHYVSLGFQEILVSEIYSE